MQRVEQVESKRKIVTIDDYERLIKKIHYLLCFFVLDGSEQFDGVLTVATNKLSA